MNTDDAMGRVRSLQENENISETLFRSHALLSAAKTADYHPAMFIGGLGADTIRFVLFYKSRAEFGSSEISNA